MKSVGLFFLLMLFITISYSQTNSVRVYNDHFTDEVIHDLGSKFVEQYPEKIVSFSTDKEPHAMVVFTTLNAIDVVQLFAQYGYEVIYLFDEKRYSLSPDGKTLKIIKD